MAKEKEITKEVVAVEEVEVEETTQVEVAKTITYEAICKERVVHNGNNYNIGDCIEFSDANEYGRLISLNIVE